MQIKTKKGAAVPSALFPPFAPVKLSLSRGRDALNGLQRSAPDQARILAEKQDLYPV
jgi:hypothetical protein